MTVTDQVTPTGAPANRLPARSILRQFHPGWFGAVMGTAIVGVAAELNPGQQALLQPVMRALGVAMAVLAYLFAVALGTPYVVRWVRHPTAAWRDLWHPVLGALYATFPAGLLVLATMTGLGGVLAIGLGVVFAAILFVTPSVPPEQANGGWFIPPVVSIILPLALLPLLQKADAPTARLLLLLGYAAWGMGFLLFLLIAALLYARLVYHALPASPMAPSLWIGLGPIGVGGLALLRLAPATELVWGPESFAVVNVVSTLAATVLWGFGLWWLATAVLLLLRYRLKGPLPYGVGWWAFTFPLGAYTVDTLALGRAWQVGLLEGMGVALFLLLLGFWLVVTVFTLVHIRSGLIWER
jgi:C4-dicarboxylate transporter/malic acid transport protein